MKKISFLLLLSMSCDVIDDYRSSCRVIDRKTAPKVISQLKRDLDAKTRSEMYRCRFRLPVQERLDGEIACHLWTPYNRLNVSGKLYISANFVCFASKVRPYQSCLCPLFI